MILDTIIVNIVNIVLSWILRLYYH